MLKNVTLLNTQTNGKASWCLLGLDGLPIGAFTAFANSLVRQHPFNTRKAYCRNLAFFIDYLFEAESVLAETTSRVGLTRARLKSVLEAYDAYLVEGENSGNEIAKLISKTLPSPRYPRQTSALMHAPVRKFLALSEYLRQEMRELDEFKGESSGIVDARPIFEGMTARKKLSKGQQRAMTSNSMLAGVIAGGPQWTKNVVLPTLSMQLEYDRERAFPFDSIAPFIENLPTYRDKAMYSLLAASGARTHEVLQLLFEDIDIGAAAVYLRNPELRANHPSYMALTPEERDRLAWKGRETECTLLIEPFVSMFFENLEMYMKYEYISHGKHEFVFQHLKAGMEGHPYFLSAASTRNAIFRTAAEKVLLGEVSVGPHSLRHAYGTYLLNYFPRSNGEYGLPIAFVQRMMGHANQKSTEKYAHLDKDLIEEELRHANLMVFDGLEPKEIRQLKIEAINAKVSKLQIELRTLSHA